MLSFEIEKLAAEQVKSGRRWLEFLRVPALSMGTYHLNAAQADQQNQHTDDEAYYVVSGRSRVRAGDAEHYVGPGSILYVEKNLEHRFFDIVEDLTVLLFFAPAVGSTAGTSS